MLDNTRRLVASLMLLASGLLCAACGDPARGLQVGASENDVMSRLGQPTSIMKKQEMIESYVEAAECPGITKLFFYHHYVSDSVLIGFGHSGTAVCVLREYIVIKY